MKHLLCSLLILLAMTTGSAFAKDLILSSDTKIQVYFSPNGGAEAALVQRIGQAHDNIYVLAYSFTSKPIAGTLVEAQHRGVHVEAVLDKSQINGKGSMGEELANSTAPVFVDHVHAIAHNKVMIIDGQTVATGSFNFTAGAEHKNAENLLIIESPELAQIYGAEWSKHKDHSAVWPN